MKKYEITDIAHPDNPNLHRIRAVTDLTEDVLAGMLGGYVESCDNLDQEGRAWISEDAIACENAVVCGDAVLTDHAVARGNAYVGKNATVMGDATVQDDALTAPQAVQLVVFAGEDVAREVSALALHAGVGMIIETVHQVRAHDVY